MPDATEVVVVGGGPAGSATALRLAKLGHSVRLLDRSIFPRDKACAEYLSPSAVRELASLNIIHQLGPDRGARIDATMVITDGGNKLTGRFGTVGATGLSLERRVMDAALLRSAQAAGVSVARARITDLLRDSHGVTGVIATGNNGESQTFHARVVVGADGLGSIVSRRAGLRTAGRLRRVAFSAHLRGVAGMTTTTEMHVSANGYLGLNALGGGVTNVSLVINATAAKAARGDATGFFWKQIREMPALHERMKSATIAREVMVTGPFHAVSRRAIADGLLLVGDAAEFFDPFTGDGIHSALVGARLAAATLHHALSTRERISAQSLASYPRLRRRAFLGKWMIERMIGYAMEAPELFDRAVKRLHRRNMADTLIGAIGSEISPWRVLNPVFLARMVL